MDNARLMVRKSIDNRLLHTLLSFPIARPTSNGSEGPNDCGGAKFNIDTINVSLLPWGH